MLPVLTLHEEHVEPLINTIRSKPSFIENMGSYTFHKYSECLINGFFIINHCKEIRIKIIISLCQAYLYDSEDEMFQLALLIHFTLQNKQRSVFTANHLKKFIFFYITSKPKMIAFYQQKFLKSRFIDKITSNLYEISMMAKIEF